MKKVKQENGVTLVALVIMIILLLVLAAVSLTYGTDSIDSSIKAANQAELEIVYNAILKEYTKLNLINSTDFIGEEVTTEEIYTMQTVCNIVIADDEISDFYKLTPEDGLIEIGIEGAEDTYIVNYEKGIVFNYSDQTAYDGTIYYMEN